MTGRSTKQVLQPNEVGEIEVELDTARFNGRRSIALFLNYEIGNSADERRFTVSATSQEP